MGHIRGTKRVLTRALFAALAPDLPPDVRDAAFAHLSPVWQELSDVDLELLWGVSPAFQFDPEAAAGRHRSLPVLPPPPADVALPKPVDLSDLPWLPLTQLASLIRRGELGAELLVDAYAERIRRHGAVLNAFLTLTADTARRAAVSLRPGRLSGMPLGIKDLVETKDVRTTAGSRILADYVPRADAVVWQRLADEGALLLGKTHTHEFAAGPTGENPHYGPSRNPWDPARITGGSSGGSAAAVAAGLCAAAIGTDTGGSVRIPAAMCGVVGLKPTFGRVDTTGVIPLSWSLDHVGPIARTVQDAALVFDVMAGNEPSQGMEAAARAGAISRLEGIRIGVAPHAWAGEAAPGVAAALEEAVHVIHGLGADIRPVAFPVRSEPLTAINRALALGESSAWHEPFLARKADLYGDNVRPRQEAGRFLSAVDYLKAQRLRALLCRAFDCVWDEVDVLILATLPVVAPRIGQKTVTLGDGCERTTPSALIGAAGPWNVLGLPVLTVPCGHGEGAMPVGLSLVGPSHAERTLGFVAAAYENATSWHLERPAATP